MMVPISSQIMLVGEYHALLGGNYLSYFQGTASYLKPGGGIARLPFNPSKLPGGYRFFFLATGEFIEKEIQVNHIREYMGDPDLDAAVRNEYQPMKQKLIEALLGIREADPALLFRIISDFQFSHFRKMIPEADLDVWIEGQISNDYYLKLSGSDSGYLLGMAHEYLQETLEERWKQEIIWIE